MPDLTLTCPHCRHRVRWEPYAAPATVAKMTTVPPPVPKPPESGEVALAGPDGRQAAALLRGAKLYGVRELSEAAAPAAARLLSRPDPARAATFFSPAELGRVAAALAATLATSDLLGAARVRLRQRAVLAGRRVFAADATDYAGVFPVPGDYPPPLAPAEAVAYFRSLVPELGTDPQRFGALVERRAFTLAAAADKVVLGRVQAVIARALEQGAAAAAAALDIDAVLADAGVSSRNPQYAEMVFRTNMMDSYNAGAARELQDPDVADAFPFWQYLGIRDGRQGADHEPHFDRYFPAGRAFPDVRGPRVFNCRCTFAPVSAAEAADLGLGGRGAALTFATRTYAFDPAQHPRDNTGRFISAGAIARAKTDPAAAAALRAKVAPKDRAKLDALIGPPPGGGPSKPRVPEQAPKSAKAARAKAAHVLVDKTVQRYAEEHNEPRFAKAMGGVSFPDSEPVDVVIPGSSGAVGHAVELKTMVIGKDDKLTMNSYAQVRKVEWERSQGATFHTVVSDDRAVKDALGPGKHDESKRVYYYRRGVAGSARISSMHQVAGGEAELKRLMAAPEEQLPPAARRTDGHLRVGRWKFFVDEKGKGYRNSKTGQEFRAKK